MSNNICFYFKYIFLICPLNWASMMYNKWYSIFISFIRYNSYMIFKYNNISALPIFKSKYKVRLKITDYRKSRSYHFLICNKKLYKDVRTNTRLRQKLNLSKNDIKALEIGETPRNYVWHHHQNPGVLQLVDRKTHEKTFHKGGFSIWGGKDN